MRWNFPFLGLSGDLILTDRELINAPLLENSHHVLKNTRRGDLVPNE